MEKVLRRLGEVGGGWDRFDHLSGTGNVESPSSFRNSLCFTVDFRICFSISTNSLCVADRSIAISCVAVLTYREMFRLKSLASISSIPTRLANYLSDEHIGKIIDTYKQRPESIERYGDLGYLSPLKCMFEIGWPNT